LTIKILLFLFLKQLFSPFPPENIANCEIVKGVLIDIYSNFSCNNRKIKERKKEIIIIKKNKENITIILLYYQLIHEKNLYFAAVIAVTVVEFFANFKHVYSFFFLHYGRHIYCYLPCDFHHNYCILKQYVGNFDLECCRYCSYAQMFYAFQHKIDKLIDQNKLWLNDHIFDSFDIVFKLYFLCIFQQ